MCVWFNKSRCRQLLREISVARWGRLQSWGWNQGEAFLFFIGWFSLKHVDLLKWRKKINLDSVLEGWKVSQIARKPVVLWGDCRSVLLELLWVWGIKWGIKHFLPHSAALHLGCLGCKSSIWLGGCGVGWPCYPVIAFVFSQHRAGKPLKCWYFWQNKALTAASLQPQSDLPVTRGYLRAFLTPGGFRALWVQAGLPHQMSRHKDSLTNIKYNLKVV